MTSTHQRAEIIKPCAVYFPRIVSYLILNKRVPTSDSLTTYRQLPMVVTLPESEEQISRFSRSAKQYQIPIVPRGAGTGLSGGAMPIADGLVLSTAKLKKFYPH